MKVTLTKNQKKGDFGVVFGCRLYIKEITNRSLLDKDAQGIQEGDIVLKINNQPCDGLSLKDVKKLIDANKEKLNLVIRRDANNNSQLLNQVNNRVAINNSYNQQSLYENGTAPGLKQEPLYNGNRLNYSNQNVYVQPPRRGPDGN